MRGASLVLIGTIAFVFGSCSGTKLDEASQISDENVVTSNGVISYEDLAGAIDAGHLAAYEGKRFRIRGHIRAYGLHGEERFVILGEPLGQQRFPTMMCMLLPSDYGKGAEFRGAPMLEGLYSSAFPERIVIMEAHFLGRIKEGLAAGMEVYGGEDCTFVQ